MVKVNAAQTSARASNKGGARLNTASTAYEQVKFIDSWDGLVFYGTFSLCRPLAISSSGKALRSMQSLNNRRKKVTGKTRISNNYQNILKK